MKAMVFAAGLGERLRPLTEKLPKALIPVAGRPMIEYPLLLLRRYGIREVIINLHHLGDKIRQHLKDGNKLGLEIAYSEEKELLDTGGGLLKAKEFFFDGTFIAINSDVIIDLSLTDLLAHHRACGGAATLVLRPDPEAARYGVIETSADTRIQRFLIYYAPRWQSAGPLSQYMFTGVQILEPRMFDYMERRDSAKFGTTKETYPRMLTQGEKLYGFPFHGFWQDTGTPERIKDADEKLTRGEIRLHYL
jgi:NDP-sugar pyrophosphorylase family protein